MNQEQQDRPEKRVFLPLGSVVILKGSVKKLLVVARGSIVEDAFFDYGAFMYPEGLVDANVAYFNHDDILKVVHEGYTDYDNELVIEILNDAYIRFDQQNDSAVSASVERAPLAALDDDMFASVRDLARDDA